MSTKTSLKFYKFRKKKVSEKNACLLNNRSFVPGILSFKTFSKSKPRCQVFVPRDWEQCGGCLAGLPRSALRLPAVPEVSGRLPSCLEAESPACPLSAARAATHSMQNNEGGWGTRVWLPEAVAPGQPVQNPMKQRFVSPLRLELECMSDSFHR